MAGEEQPRTTSKFELTVKLMSAETLCVLKVEPFWTFTRVKDMVQFHLNSEQTLKSLLKDSEDLKFDDTLSAAGLEKDSEIMAVVIGVPALHLFKPCSAGQLSERRGCGDKWMVGGDDDGYLVAQRVQHRDMQGVSSVAQEVAHAMAAAAPDLETTVVNSSESDEQGEIIVISDPGDDAKLACFKALGLLSRYLHPQGPELLDSATFEEKDWGSHLKWGFNRDKLQDDGGPDAGLLAITKIMAEHLSRHFEFSFSDEVVTAPVIYGGYTSDGYIVGVLSARVRT